MASAPRKRAPLWQVESAKMNSPIFGRSVSFILSLRYLPQTQDDQKFGSFCIHRKEYAMNEIVEFLLDNNARISNGDKWMVVCKVGEDVFYTVRQQSYGKRKATTLYDGIYLATALRYLGEES